MISQDPASALNPVLRIGRRIGDALTLHRGVSGSAVRSEALRLLDLVGIPDAARRLDAYPHEMSGGQNQRVIFGNSLLLLVCLMGLFGWERHAVSSGLAIAANEQGYASAVRQLGASPFRVYLRHILPNIASTLIVMMTLVFPEVILLESALSFLGLGVQPPMTSLGNMVGFDREYITRAPWIMLSPASTIVLTTLAVSILSDFLRDRLDPTLR